MSPLQPPATPSLSREKLEWRLALAAILLPFLVWVWALPVLPGQDLPQHLAMARIWMDHASSPLYQTYYQLPDHLEPYFLIPRLLSMLGSLVGLMAALRIVLTVYFLTTVWTFHRLVRAMQGSSPSDSPPWTTLLVALILWNPIAALGLLPFLTAVPLFLFAASLLFQHPPALRLRRPLLGAISTLGLFSLHPFASAAFTLLALLHALTRPSRRTWLEAGSVLLCGLLALSLWGALGGTGLAGGTALSWEEARARTVGLDIISDLWKVRWGEPPVKLNYVLWSLLGPWPLGSLFLLALPWVGLLALLWWSRGRASPTTSPRPLEGKVPPALAQSKPLPRTEPAPLPGWALRTVLAFLLAAWLSPWALNAPEELTFIDLRLLSLGTILLLAATPSRPFSEVWPRRLLVACCLLVSLHTAIRATGFAREAAPALRLISQAPTGKMMLSWVLHNKTEHFGRQFQLTHFLPMYYTVNHAGLNTQFWGRYTHHLPIDYRPGRRPAQAPDWQPSLFTPAHLRDAQLLLVQAPTADDPRREREAFRATTAALSPYLRTLGCDADWCLYDIKGGPAFSATQLRSPRPESHP